MREMTIDEPSTPVPRPSGKRPSGKKPSKEAKGKARSKGGRPADQFCIYHRKDQADIPTLLLPVQADNPLLDL